MKLLLLTSLFMTSLVACSNQKPTVVNTTPENGIIGGQLLPPANITSKYVALLFNNKTETYCSSLVLKPQILLTAAHCVPEDLADLIVAFGIKPQSGAYKLRRVDFAKIHPHFQAHQKGRNDLALIHITQKAPKGTRFLEIPASDFPLQKGLYFTALGYGRTAGTNAPSENGELRSVDLQISEFSDNRQYFIVNQKNGKGICNGDSGGPAVMRFQSKDFVIGVASAISWHTPSELSDDQKKEYNKRFDVCSDRSIYMNVQEYRAWLESSLAEFGN